MPMEADALAELKSMVAVARKRPLSFGICLGKKPEGAVFLLDRKKKPDILQRNAKKEGETPKVCGGTASVKGKIISLCIEGDAPAGLIKHMKSFMGKTAELPMKFVLVDASGAVLEAEEGDAEEFAALPSEADEDLDAGEAAAPEAPAAPEMPPEAPEAPASDDARAEAAAEKMRAALGVLTRQIEALPDGPATAKLQPVAAHVGGQIEAGDLVKASAGLKALKDAIGKVSAAPAADAAADADAAQAPASDPKWDKMRAVLEPRVAEALKANHPEAGKIRAVWAFALEKGDAGNAAAALQAGERLVGLLKAAAAAPAEAPDEAQKEAPASDAPPVNARALAVARLKWIDTKRQMKTDLDTFHAAVVKQADGDADKNDIAAAATALITQFEAFDDNLQDMLDDVVNTADGPKREGFKKQADGAIKDYQRVLDTPFFRLIDDNPFTKVNVSSNARLTLELVSSALN